MTDISGWIQMYNSNDYNAVMHAVHISQLTSDWLYGRWLHDRSITDDDMREHLRTFNDWASAHGYSAPFDPDAENLLDSGILDIDRYVVQRGIERMRARNGITSED